VADVPSPHPAPFGDGRVARRAVLAGALGGAGMMAVAACSDDTSTGTKPPGSPAGLAPDVAVATTALTEIRAVREAVTGTLRRFPATRSVVGSLVALHQTHEATLVDAVPARASTSAAPSPYAVPRNRDRALARLAAREQQLHDTLDGLAMRAQSGQFARLLASMGAAVQQRLVEWPG
jgi:hypothetical protein